jgi:2,3-bisphosphoglycerate-independent phosphoglycerate mutase
MRAFLLILDGWGLGAKYEADAIAQANTPVFDQLWKEHPHATLTTFGEEVGLPEGQMGNSEVGHLNIGAGRVVWQELARVNKAVRERTLHSHPVLTEALRHARTEGRAVHFLGLVSDGGVHSHIEHLKALCDMAVAEGCPKTYIHAFTDGRDCDPKSGAVFLNDLTQHIAHTPVKIASVVGRYYAMDRDKRWERIRLAYDLLVNGQGEVVEDILEAVNASYKAGITDEFLKPMRCLPEAGEGTIRPHDVVICFNFRTDRLRELTVALSQQDMPEYDMKALPLYYVTLTRYDDTYRNVHVVFEKDDVSETLGELVAAAGKTQLRIAETEKYPHVTFFFSGGREQVFEKERRIMIPSPKEVATYDMKPEMSALQITEAVMDEMRYHQPDFICLNFANTDMVGHTGVFSAAMKAAETVDGCLGRILPLALDYDYSCLIIADHGNSDYMINEDGTPNTAHTKNPVPCILVSRRIFGKGRLSDGSLADVAPTLLRLLGLEQPAAMTGKSLIVA